MKRALALLGLVPLLAVVLWLPERGRPTKTVAVMSDEAMAPASFATPAPGPAWDRERSSEELLREDARSPRALRGRVVADAREAPTGFEASLRFVTEWLASAKPDAEGHFEFPPPLRPGTHLIVRPPDGWRVEPEELELDEVPEDELLFRAWPAEPSAAAPVEGVVVHDSDGTPVPYLSFSVDEERLESDEAGTFTTREPHPKATLRFGFVPWGWSFDVAFDPEDPEPLRVPVRVGPTVYVAVEGPADHLAAWHGETQSSNAVAIAIPYSTCYFRKASPALVRLPWHERAYAPTGEIYVGSTRGHVFARAGLAPERGTRAAPLELSLETCAWLEVQLELAGRGIGWWEDVSVSLAPAHGGASVRALEANSPARFAVLRPGEYAVEAALDGVEVGRSSVFVRLGETQHLALRAELPPQTESDSHEADLVPVRGRVTSATNRPAPGYVRITRLADGAEERPRLAWGKTDGRWEATFAAEAPRGDVRIALELEPCFSVSGPRFVELPSAGELRYVIEDDVERVDVYVVPVAAEDGGALLSFDSLLVLDDGDTFAGEDFGSPTLPVASGHPSDVPFTALCIAPGRGAAALRYEGRAEGGDVRLPVELARGWGAILYAGDANAEPLEGVEVLLDGIESASTGSHGFAALSAASRPASIALRYRDWTIDDGDVALDGSFDDASVYVNAYLVPPRR